MDATAFQTQDVFSKSGAKLRIQDGGVGSDTLSGCETWKPDPGFQQEGG